MSTSPIGVDRSVRRGWLALACVAALVVILWAPFAGEVRSRLRAQFPGGFVAIVGSAIALLIGGAVVVAVTRIRERRPLRYGAIAAAVAVGVLYSSWSRTGRADADVVERFHFIEFGLVTFLFYRALQPRGDLSSLVMPVLAGLLVGTGEEWFQWFIPVRVGEMRDIFLNGAAITSGLLFSAALEPPSIVRPMLPPRSVHRIAALTAIVIVAIAGFFHSVHLATRLLMQRLARSSRDTRETTWRGWQSNGPSDGGPRRRRSRFRVSPAKTST